VLAQALRLIMKSSKAAGLLRFLKKENAAQLNHT
jgi:hypothetical protein